MRKNLKILIAFIVVAALGMVAFILLKQTQPSVKTALPQKAAKLAKVKRINLVTLGDSLTEGIGDDKGEQGYSGRIAKKIETQYNVAVTMSNFGKAGDRSDQIQERLNAQPKFQHAVKQANVIVLTSGGNDLQQSLLKNVFAKTPTDLTAAVVSDQATYQTKLTRLFHEIRTYNRQAPIFIFGNYNPLFVHFPQRKDLNQDVQLFNTINSHVAKQDKNGYYVGSFDLTFGQYRSKKMRQSLGQQAAKKTTENQNSDQAMTATLMGETHVKNTWISQTDNYHPNSIGYNYMTTQLYHVMRKEQEKWLIKH
ncbi:MULTISPECIES: GDSL-type esterase/lipase family protein [Leuconostoc gelidum group]|uniref:GDSL-type esterase/lipase family protein n=1 Tax=Leuconostoc gelidum group TaxID=3016637 RepID=UPI00021937C0|nr:MULTISPECIES: GDSL-type esterase/lipase family protein [Leuconostoc gelidum group]AFS40350.1 lipase/acylhydrolase [Leuconostoc gelidum JB7]MBZ5960854.1 lysophospholipase [Leuconostoc gasicomitatum]MBZ5991274.1 lysophospholipase [Leuconostoc gelidum subsp. gelidum]MBZ5994704.1 lysophospholipase [Leuconostoc gasicomitatum]MBZ6001348.1 lysophospholipase [Leuconostoc gelidum subsp. gelidum]